MCFNIADGFGRNPGAFPCLGNHSLLSKRVGRSDTVGSAVVVDRASLNHGINIVVVAHGALIGLEQEHNNALAEDRAAALLVKRADAIIIGCHRADCAGVLFLGV